MCVSPYPHVTASPTNSCLYWIGRYADERFDLEHATGEARESLPSPASLPQRHQGLQQNAMLAQTCPAQGCCLP